MNPSLNFSIDPASFTTTHPVSGELATRLARLCQTLRALYTGQPADLSTVAQDFASLAQWIRQPKSGAAPEALEWSAQILSFPGGAGGQAVFRDAQQALTLTLDGSSQPIFGLWQSLLPGDEALAFSFQLENQALVLDDGKRQSRHALPGAAGLLGWGSLSAFTGQLMNLFSRDSEAAPAQAPVVPVQEFVPIEEPVGVACPSCGTSLSPDARFCKKCGAAVGAPAAAAPLPSPVQTLPVLPLPTAPVISDLERTPKIPVNPAKPQAPTAPLLSENAMSKPAPVQRPVVIDPKTWKCACGSLNTGQFCPKCGSEKPDPVDEQKGQPAQPAFCRHCGGALSVGTRFCRNCGTKVQG